MKVSTLNRMELYSTTAIQKADCKLLQSGEHQTNLATQPIQLCFKVWVLATWKEEEDRRTKKTWKDRTCCEVWMPDSN